MTGELTPLCDQLGAVIAAVFPPLLDPAPSVNGDAAPPLRHDPRTLYIWAVDDTITGQGGSELVRSDFRLRVEWCEAPVGEEPTGTRDRDVSDRLGEMAYAAVAAITAARNGAPIDDEPSWGHVRVERITHDSVRLLQFRGWAMDISGWRFIDYLEDD